MRLKETLSPNSVGSIVSVKGLSGTLQALWVLFSLKGSQVTLTTAGCLPIGPETEKRHGQRRREKQQKETKREPKYFPDPTLFLFFKFVCFENRPDGCQWVGTESQGGEDVCGAFMCVCVWLFMCWFFSY